MSVFLYGMASTFHSRCGRRVILTNSNKTAVRNFSEFNYGLVFSSKPLVDDQLYQVRIDKKASHAKHLENPYIWIRNVDSVKSIKHEDCL